MPPHDPRHPAVASKRAARTFMVNCHCGHKHACVLATAPPPRRAGWLARRRHRAAQLDAFLTAWERGGDR